jgi:hypothetical protein
MDIILALLPAICLGVIVGIEIPEHWRRRLFVFGIFGWRPPIFLYTFIYGIFVKTTLEGVLGSYGIFVTDIASYPLLLIIAWRTRRRYALAMKSKGGLNGKRGRTITIDNTPARQHAGSIPAAPR